MFRWAAILGLAGLAIATGVIIWSGFAQVVDALSQAGWAIPAVAAFHFLPLAVASEGWRVLTPGKNKPSSLRFIYFMWIRAAINNLMPVARIGGEFAAVRLMTAYGMRRSAAIASTVVETTLSIGAIFVFVALGILLFAVRVNEADAVMQLMWGFVVMAPFLGAFIIVQRIGLFGVLLRIFRLFFRDKWKGLAGDAARLDKAVITLYRRRGRLFICALCQFVSWTLGTGEIWIALTFLGQPLPLLEAFMLEGVIQGTASAAFAVPGALGVQEAGFLVFGGMLGLPHDTAAALAIIRRCRDIICYGPGLIVWQIHEGRKLFKS